MFLEFFFKKKCEERMAKEWANKEKYPLPMVYLSLVCRCQGPKRSCGWFRLGEIGRWQVVLLAGLHRSNRCRSGQTAS
jgi:hypothetical protein